MATNKERIEALEQGLGSLQDTMQRLEVGIAEKLQQLEAMISKLPDVFNHKLGKRDTDDINRPWVSPKTSKLDFPRFSGDDPTEWITKAKQFFEFQQVRDDRKVHLASYHLEGEANTWWQWLKESYKEEDVEVTWETLQEELWARFGPAEGENVDEALAKIKQEGSLRDYQRDFERLGNKVRGWTQKALVGTFMGGLHPEIADAIRMFKPRSLKEAIGYARMKDQQLQRQQRKLDPPTNQLLLEAPPVTKKESVVTTKRLAWDEMQRRRARGLCFNCDERFTPGHRCQTPNLLLLLPEEEEEGPNMRIKDFEGGVPEADAETIRRQP